VARTAKYRGTQLPLIALEVARAGRILSRAVTALQEEYESFRSINARTIKTYMQDANFRALVATAEKALGEKYQEEIRERVGADCRRAFHFKTATTN